MVVAAADVQGATVRIAAACSNRPDGKEPQTLCQTGGGSCVVRLLCPLGRNQEAVQVTAVTDDGNAFMSFAVGGSYWSLGDQRYLHVPFGAHMARSLSVWLTPPLGAGMNDSPFSTVLPPVVRRFTGRSLRLLIYVSCE